MYARTIQHGGEEQTLSFGVSGKLIMNVLVMYDRQTESYWSQILGEAVKGPMSGAQLTALPVLQTTWQEWRTLHPATLALDTNGMGRYDTYSSYYNSRQTGVIGETRTDNRLPAKELILGTVLDDVQIAYPHSLLTEQTVIHDEIDDRQLLIVFQPETKAGIVYDRLVDDAPLTFSQTENPHELIDAETGSTWFLLTGTAVDGPLAGKELHQLPSTSSFWFGCKDWYPETRLYGD